MKYYLECSVNDVFHECYYTVDSESIEDIYIWVECKYVCVDQFWGLFVDACSEDFERVSNEIIKSY